MFDISDIGPVVPANLKEFDPSYVTRYAIISELVKKAEAKFPRKKLRILDVGGYNGALADFLPGRDITILDIIEDDKLKNYVRADGARMPFEDESFDLVVSCDTLEHIKAPDRDNFISEMVRVTAQYMFLCAPFGSEAVVKAERVADTFYQGMTQESYVWLKEHKEYGLPQKKWLRDKLKNLAYDTLDFDHSTLDLWILLLSAGFFLAGNVAPVNKALYKKLRKGSEKYLTDLTYKDFPDEGYRTFFIASKKEKLGIKLPAYDRSAVDEYLYAETKTVGAAIKELTQSVGISHIQLQQAADRIATLDKLTADQGETIKSLRSEIAAIKQSKTYKLAHRMSNAAHKIKK